MNPSLYIPFALSFRTILEMNTVGIQNMFIVVDNSAPYIRKSSYTFLMNINNSNLAGSEITIDSTYKTSQSNNGTASLSNLLIN